MCGGGGYGCVDVGVGVGAWGVVFLCMQVNKHAWMHKHECVETKMNSSLRAF